MSRRHPHPLALPWGAAVLAALLALPAAGAAQPTSHFRTLGLDDGLSQASVTALVQDSLGFLWVGTQDGLNRYDGMELEVFREGDGGLPNGHVTALEVGPDGTLWVGTFGGLARYDAATGRFETLPVDDEPGALPSSTVRSLAVDPSGSVRVGTARGVSRWDPAAGVFRSVWDAGPVAANDVRALARDGTGRLWLGTSDGLWTLDPAAGMAERVVVRGDTVAAEAVVWTVLAEEDGRVWVGGDRSGLVEVDPAAGTVRRHRADPDDPRSLPDDDVRALHRGRDGALWVGTFDGLARLDPGASGFTTWHHDPAAPRSLPQSSVGALTVDREGLLWVGTMTAGVAVHDPTNRAFAHYRSDPDDPSSLADDVVYETRVDPSGTLWVGTRNGGLHRFDPATGTFTRFRHRPGDAASLSSDYVVAVDAAPDGTLWVATYQDGLNRLDPATGRVTRYRHDPDDPGSLASDWLRDVLVAPDGTVWVGTAGGGLDRLDPATGRFEHHRYREGDPGTLVSDFVRALHLDRRGDLWVGTYGSGASRLDPATGRVTRFLHDPDDPGTLGSRFVRSITEDRAGRLWFATDHGLSRLDPGAEEFVRYGPRDGIPAGVVYGVLEDAAGRLWMSTNDGLALFDPADGTGRVFGVEDGVQGEEFNTGAFDRGPDGRMYFGGVEGLTVFHPDSVRANLAVPPVRLTDVRLFNRPMEVSDTSGLAVQPAVAEEIVLDPEDRMITLEFAALSFRQPAENRYRYRLEGFDDAWVPTEAENRQATFTALPPGTYRFVVQGSNDDGVWNEEGARVTLRVLPAFWQTAWFRALVALALVGLLAGLVSWRMADLRRRNALLEERVRERTAALETNLAELRASTAHIKRLEGLLPICSSCKKIRVEADPVAEQEESWVGVTTYIRDRTDADFSHGICPDCAGVLYPDFSAED